MLQQLLICHVRHGFCFCLSCSASLSDTCMALSKSSISPRISICVVIHSIALMAHLA